MNAARHFEVKAIFAAACELPAAQIPAFVQARCGDDQELAQQVYALLEADAAEDGFLEQAPAPEATPGAIIGERGYQLIRLLGSGGMGEVHLAERNDGSFRQRVAIKLILPGQRLSRVALQRFRAERQILATLKHPNIARLLDGGTLAGGTPFLVMEYIEGVRLDEWVRREQPDVETRLLLFEKVCAAVASAHQALIVHRDLKPGNILVTPEGEPKLMDFGIAKVLNAEWFAHSVAQTHTGQAPMTLAYASPEQVRGAVVGTASDVYSLGVVFYELLTGNLPYRIPSADPVGLARAICEEEALPPSRNNASAAATRVSPAAQPLGSPTVDLQRRLRGDLDAIAGKALRKEPSARYGSVEQFAADIRRHLEGRPVLARRGTASYRLRKFLWRERWPVGAGTAVFAILLGAVLMLRAELARTELERDKAARVSDFIVQMFERSNPHGSEIEDSAQATRITVREVMDRNAPRIATELGDSPEVQANLLAVVARIYDGLSLPERARAYGEAALEQLARSGRIPSHESVEVRLFLVQSLSAGNQQQAALEQAELALAESIAVDPGDSFDRARALRGRGAVLRNLERWDGALADAQAARAMFERVRGKHDPFVAGTLRDLALIAAGTGDFARCNELARDSLAGFRSQVASEQLVIASVRATQAECLSGLGDLAGAEAALRENLAMQEKVLGADSLAAGHAMNALGNLLNQQQRFAEAEPMLAKSVEINRRELGAHSEALVAPLLNLSTAVFELGRQDEGIELQQQALALAPRTQPQQYATAVNNLGYKLFQVGRVAEAEQRLREATTLFASAAPHHPDRALSLSSLGRLLLESGRAEEAQPLISEALDIRLAALPPGHWGIADSKSLLGACLAARGEHARAESLLREGLAGLTTALGAEHARTQRAHARLDAFLKNR